MHVIESRDAEPSWDGVSFYRCDFRPHFDGDLVNICTCIEPQVDLPATERLVEECASKIARWIRLNKQIFGAEDRFQIVVGWPRSICETGRQIIKDGGDWEAVKLIEDGKKKLRFLKQWWSGVLTNEEANKS